MSTAKLPRCPICNGRVEEWGGSVRCDNCPFWADVHHLRKLAEQAAKARAYDKRREHMENINEFMEAGEMDFLLDEELKKGGLDGH